MWDRSDLARRVGRSLDVAANALAELAAEGFHDPLDPTASVGPQKVVAETALLLLATEHVAARFPRVATGHAELVALLAPHARSERVVAAVCLEPALALDHAFAHLCLGRLGRRDDRIDALLARTLDAPRPVRERLPHRDLEQAFLLRLAGRAAERATNVALRASLGRPGDALAPTRDDLYAFTHAVMYATDLGHRLPRIARGATGLTADATAYLAWCLHEQDYDLAGEVLLTWPYLRAPWSPAGAFGFLVLATVEDRAGFLPTPVTRLDRYRSLPPDAARRYALATAYHTAFVMGLVCAAALRAGTHPAPAPPHAAATEALLDVTGLAAADRHWTEVLRELPAERRAGVAPLVLAVGLQQAVARRDLAGVHRLCTVAEQHALATTLPVRQAVALLERSALLLPLLADSA